MVIAVDDGIKISINRNKKEKKNINFLKKSKKEKELSSLKTQLSYHLSIMSDYKNRNTEERENSFFKVREITIKMKEIEKE